MNMLAILHNTDSKELKVPVPPAQDINDRTWLEPYIYKGWYLYDFVPDIPPVIPTVTPNPVTALQTGKTLPNPAKWKFLQNLINTLVPVAVVAGTFIPGASVILNSTVLESIAAAMGAVNAYLTTATTGKIGI